MRLHAKGICGVWRFPLRSAVIGARIGDINDNGVDYYLQVTEKRDRKRNLILLDAAATIFDYLDAAGIRDDIEGPLFRRMTRDGLGFQREFLSRRTPGRLVKEYCHSAGINPDRLGRRGISPHSLRKSSLIDAIQNGAPMTQVQALAGHKDIRTTQLYYDENSKDAELAARRIQIRPSSRKERLISPK